MREKGSRRDSSERQAQAMLASATLEDDDDEQDEDDYSTSGGSGVGGGADQYTLQLASTVAVNSEVFSLAFSEDGRFLLACCGDGVVRVLNPSTGATMSVLATSSSPKNLQQQPVGDASNGGGVEQSRVEGSGGNPSTRRRDCRIRGSSGSSSSADAALAAATVARTNISSTKAQLPCTCAVFRPRGKLREKTSGVALIGYSNGEVQFWHVPSSKFAKKLLHRQEIRPQQGVDEDEDQAKTRLSFTLSERSSSYETPLGVEVLCVAFSAEGDRFAVGASDGAIRIFNDDADKALLSEMKPGRGHGPGHSSRVFSVKFHPDDSNMLVSGGWDDCVYVWDVARGVPTRTIFGPHVCGDAIGVTERTILTGSWREDAQLEAWNIDTGTREGPPFWSGFGSSSNNAAAMVVHGGGAARRCRLYAATFGGPEGWEGRFVAAGGGDGANEAKVFDFQNERRLIGSLLGLSAGAISLAFGDGGAKLAVGLADGLIHFVDINPIPTKKKDSKQTTEASQQPQQGGKTIMF